MDISDLLKMHYRLRSVSLNVARFLLQPVYAALNLAHMHREIFFVLDPPNVPPSVTVLTCILTNRVSSVGNTYIFYFSKLKDCS